MVDKGKKKNIASLFLVVSGILAQCGIASPETKGHTMNNDIICECVFADQLVRSLSIWRATEFQPENFAHSKFNTFFVVVLVVVVGLVNGYYLYLFHHMYLLCCRSI